MTEQITSMTAAYQPMVRPYSVGERMIIQGAGVDDLPPAVISAARSVIDRSRLDNAAQDHPDNAAHFKAVASANEGYAHSVASTAELRAGEKLVSMAWSRKDPGSYKSDEAIENAKARIIRDAHTIAQPLISK